MKKTVSLLLAVLLLCGAGTLAAQAVTTQPIHVYDLLKHDADGSTRTCRTVEIFFENQFCLYNETQQITLQRADGAVAANCVPYADNNRKLDLYAPDGSFGVVIDPFSLYYLVIPEGAYYTTDGVANAAYSGEYSGIYLSNTADRFTARDLCIANFLAGKAADNKLYSGKLLVSTAFTTLLSGANSVRLYKTDGGRETLLGVYPITSYKPGQAHVEFGGVGIDRYATYKLRVRYATVMYSDGQSINDNSEYTLSGKRLLGLSEKYPAIDFLIAAFGADHWSLKVFTKALDVLAFFRLVDKAMVKDIRQYIDAKK